LLATEICPLRVVAVVANELFGWCGASCLLSARLHRTSRDARNDRPTQTGVMQYGYRCLEMNACMLSEETHLALQMHSCYNTHRGCKDGAGLLARRARSGVAGQTQEHVIDVKGLMVYILFQFATSHQLRNLILGVWTPNGRVVTALESGKS
jgi:hypothetical protein